MRFSKYVLGWTLALGMASSGALTIGSVRGDVWIEQPLELVVPVQVEASALLAGLCPSAEVVYGDTPVDPRMLRLAQESGPDAESLLLRIVVRAPVNEAVVTVTVQLGCAQKVTRRFVLLPDVPAVLAGTADGPLTVQEEPVPPPAAVPAVVEVISRPVAKPLSGAASDGTASPRKRPSPPKPVATQPAEAETGGAGASRLTLAPLTVAGQGGPIAPLFHQTPDPELAAAQEELRKLRADYLGLQLQAMHTEAEFVSLRQHLEKAEADRNTVLAIAGGGFAALVVLTAGGLVWWGRRERERLVQAVNPDPEEEALLSDLHPVVADQWMTPRPLHPDLEEDAPSTDMVDIDVVLPDSPPPAAR